MVQRWVFHDLQTDALYTFTVNPNEGGTPPLQKKIGYQATTAPDGALIAFEGRDEAQASEFTGTILYRQQYDAMINWFGRRHVIEMTDDLGRIFTIYIQSFEAKRVRSASHPWKHTYSVKYLVLGMEMPPLTPSDLLLAEATLEAGG